MRISIAVCLLVLAAVSVPSARLEDPKLLRILELPGVQGRIDHLAADRSSQKLYVAALGNNTVEVVDLRTGALLKSLTGFREPQGIAAATDPHVIAVANGQGAGVQTLDAGDYRVLKNISLGDDADNVRYDAGTKTLYVGYGDGAIAAVDPGSGSVKGRVAVGGHPESFQLERAGSRLYVNVPTAGNVTVIDRAAMKVVSRWPVTRARSNFPMALDERAHRLFIGCRRPAKLLVYDTQRGTVLGEMDIVSDTDDLFYDAARQRVYVSGGEGFLDVFDASDSARLIRLAHLATAAGARTSLFVPETGYLYLAVPRRGTQHAEIRVFDMRD